MLAFSKPNTNPRCIPDCLQALSTSDRKQEDKVKAEGISFCFVLVLHTQQYYVSDQLPDRSSVVRFMPRGAFTTTEVAIKYLTVSSILA